MESIEIVSLGAGVQSTTMLLMAAHGEITPKPKYAIFADTGWEPKNVYEHLEWLIKEVAKYGIEIIVTSHGNIKEDMLKTVLKGTRSANMPFYTLSDENEKGIVRRQCTTDYKINPVRKQIRKILGYKPREKIKKQVNLWMGISTDEIQRMKPSQVKWITNKYPLIEKGMNRQDCLMWMKRKGYPEPPKSNCIGCPFHNNYIWLNMKKNDKKAWIDAVDFDKAIRNYPKLTGQAYLHKSCKPLDEVDLQENQITIDDFLNECEGMCEI